MNGNFNLIPGLKKAKSLSALFEFVPVTSFGNRTPAAG